MNFLALMLGLSVEKLLTNLFHLREFHWLDRLFDAVFRRVENAGRNRSLLMVAALVLLLVVPVAAVEVMLAERLAYIPAFAFAVIVLLFCLGPRDLVEEVDAYRQAVAAGDREEVALLATELLECRPGADEPPPDIECAIYAQANNRIFGVVFWFILLGATGAWLFRVLDLIRRRAIRRTGIVDICDAPVYLQAVLQLHGLLAWIPARLLMFGYTLAGSYDGAMQAWRRYRPAATRVFPRDDDQLLGAVGQGAAPVRGGGDPDARARVAVDLVKRTLWMIWCPALALMTVSDWIF